MYFWQIFVSKALFYDIYHVALLGSNFEGIKILLIKLF